MRWRLTILAAAFATAARAQSRPDTIHLSDVIVKGFETGQRLAETPAAVGYVTSSDFSSGAGASMLQGFNTIPGVSMEERSPDSYRLSIRGSLLGSPFGVRNVKVYWEDMPLTDASGNTYVNVLDQNAVRAAEVIKGPAGSMYGATTGGVVIFHGDTAVSQLGAAPAGDSREAYRVQLRGGSYNMWGADAQGAWQRGSLFTEAFASHNQSDGYRVNTQTRKDVVQEWGHVAASNNDEVEWFALYTNLYYQTPGALTFAQMLANPKAARAPTATVAGAVETHAGVFAQTYFTGLTNHWKAGRHWTSTSTVLVSGTHFDNPFLTDYERRRELTLDGLLRWIYDDKGWRLVFGGEYQYTRSYIHDYGNTDGEPDTTQGYYRLQAYQFIPYVQGERRLGSRWLVQAGISTNTFDYRYQPLYGTEQELQRIDFHLQVLPRVSIRYDVIPDRWSGYASLSRGYSPPTIAEIFPGTAQFYSGLQPEQGWNYEVGTKVFALDRRLALGLSLFDFRLQETIVPRTDSAGHAYYVNAGGTDQKGLEAAAQWVVLDKRDVNIKLHGAWTLQDYHFTDYVEDNADYSGNALTGVPRTVTVTGFDLEAGPGWYLLGTYEHTSALPVNDAGTAFARAYDLVQGKAGKRFRLGRVRGEVFAGVDNALNQRYSLGNDLNAAGGLYYNPAPARNFYGGAVVRF